jgi:hypothetical protein
MLAKIAFLSQSKDMNIHEGTPVPRKSRVELARAEAIRTYEERYFVPAGLYRDPEQIIEMNVSDISVIVDGTIAALQARTAIRPEALKPPEVPQLEPRT